MQDKAAALRERTKTFAIRVVRFANRIPACEGSRVVGRQLARAATAVAANYRATCLARSRAEFTAKLGVVAEEADETVYWLEVMLASGLGSRAELTEMLLEARQLSAIFLASRRTLREGRK
jgi:four helix bundle protein